VFLHAVAIAEIIDHIVKMLKILVYLDVPASWISSMLPPALRYPFMKALAKYSAFTLPLFNGCK